MVGVNTYLTDGLLSTQTQRNPDSYSTQIEGTEKGPVIKTIAKLQHQLGLYILQIEFVYDWVLVKMYSSCMVWRNHHHHHIFSNCVYIPTPLGVYSAWILPPLALATRLGLCPFPNIFLKIHLRQNTLWQYLTVAFHPRANNKRRFKIVNTGVCNIPVSVETLGVFRNYAVLLPENYANQHC